MATAGTLLSEWLEVVLPAVEAGDGPGVELAYARLRQALASGPALDPHLVLELHTLALRAAASGGDEALCRALERRVHLIGLELGGRRR